MKNYNATLIRAALWFAFLTTFSSGQQVPETARPGFSSRNFAFETATVLTKAGEPVTPRSQTIETGYEGCPLTLLLIFNVAPGGASKYLETPRARRSGNNPMTSSETEFVGELMEEADTLRGFDAI